MKISRKWRRSWERDHSDITWTAPVQAKASHPLTLFSQQMIKSMSALGRAAVTAGISLSVLAGAHSAYALPSGGSITAGQGQIAQNSNTLTVTQNTDKLLLNWQSFNIGQGEKVQFFQPGTQSVALNRILGNNASAIYGQLSANGKVFLINPNGVLFAPGAQVNVGGLVASSLQLSDSDFLKGQYTFTGNGTKGAIINQGSIQAVDGGYVALLGDKVANEGVILANKGSIALGAGSKATLDFTGDGLINISVSQAALDAQVTNNNLLQADGGLVVMTAGTKDSLVNNVVNNSGLVRAQSLQNKNGVIRLEGNAVTNAGTLDASGKSAGQAGGTVKVLGDSIMVTDKSAIDAAGDVGGGTVLVGGAYQGGGNERRATNTTVAGGATINADAITGGNGGQVVVWADDTTSFAGTISAKGGNAAGSGGSVETSGKHTLRIGDAASVNTTAAHGAIGHWLLDPADFTIAASGGDITGAVLSKNLSITDVTISSNSGSNWNGNGDIHVNDTVSWQGHTLTLTAQRNININAVMAASGNASLSLNSGPFTGTVLCGFNADGTFKGKVNFNGKGTLKMNDAVYTVITSLGAAGSTTGTDLQGMAGNLAGKYVLGADIDATAAAGWNGGKGFTPIGSDYNTQFTGIFDGLGHTVSNLKLTSDNSALSTGLFGFSNGTIRNVGLTNLNITATAPVNHTVGGIAGVNYNSGVIKNSYVTGTITAKLQQGTQDDSVGGLVGRNYGVIDSSYSAANIAVTGNTTNTSGDAEIGGLVGYNGSSGYVINSYHTGTVNGSAVTFAGGSWGMDFGGLVGRNDGTIKESYNAGTVSGGQRSSVGGLAGFNYPGSILASYNTGSITGSSYTGGLAGRNYNKIEGSYNTGTITGTGSYAYTGGLVGYNNRMQNNMGNIRTSYNTGTVTGGTGSSYTGGLVAYNSSDSGVIVEKSYNTGAVTGVAGKTGGLAGGNTYYSQIKTSYWDTGTSGQSSAVGEETNGAVSTNLTGLATANAFTKSQYSNFDFNTDWFMIDGFTRPFAQAEYSKVITNAHQLQLMAKDPSAAYTLGRDISMAELNSTAGGLWRNITWKAADGSFGFVPIANFSSTFDGFGHTISSLIIVSGKPGASVGLFANTSGQIRNVGLTNASVKATGDGSNAGTLAGVNAGRIINSYSSGTVTGGTNGNVGGLVGSNKYLGPYAIGTIIDSYSAGAVTGGTGSNAGGLAGSNTGVIQTAYSTGAVSGGSTRGGLVGLNDTDSVNNIAGSITNSYWNITATGQNSGIGNDLGTSSGLSGLSGTGLKAAASYTGFNFDGPWRIYEGSSLPLLRVFLTPLLVTANDVTTTYNGSVYAKTPGYTSSIAGANFGTITYGGTYTTGKNAGTYTITPSVSYSGGQQGYDIRLVDGTLTINKAPLSVSNVQVNDKVYDGNTVAGLGKGYILNGVVASDGANLTLTGEFVDKNVGDNKVVSLVLGGIAADNYSVDTSSLKAAGKITKKDLTVTAAGNDKVYNGKVDATVTYNYDKVSGDNLSVAGNAQFSDKNVGTGKTITVSGLAISGSDAGNYTLTSTSATTSGEITARPLTVAAAGGTKTYDGSLTAPVKYSGWLDGDALEVTGTAVFADKNVGTGKTITVGGLAISGADAGNYTLTDASTITSGNITARPLTLAATGVDKIYDGKQNATVTYSDDRIDGDSLTVTGTAVFGDKNVGTGKTIAVSELAISGTDAKNYTLTNDNASTTTSGNITARQLTVTATGVNKVYDAGRDADVTYSGWLDGDALEVTGTAMFGDKNVGTDKTITVSGLAISGTDAKNYTLTNDNASATTSGNITARSLTVTATGVNKVYDARRDAAVTYSGWLDGDAVEATGTAMFSDKNVGNGKTIAVSGLAVSGTDAGNYTLANASATASADITPRSLEITAIGKDKFYDGMTNATVVYNDNRLDGDSLKISGDANFADTIPGRDRLITVSALTATGVDAANYTLVDQTAGVKANILPSEIIKAAIKHSDNKTTAQTVQPAPAVVSGNPNGPIEIVQSGINQSGIAPMIPVAAPPVASQPLPAAVTVTPAGGQTTDYSVVMADNAVTMSRAGETSSVAVGESRIAVVSARGGENQISSYSVTAGSGSLTVSSGAAAANLSTPPEPSASAPATTFSLAGVGGQTAEFQVLYAENTLSIRPLNVAAATMTQDKGNHIRLVVAAGMLAAEQNLSANLPSVAAVYFH